ncbi:efflux RND transporter periplasmic adaptor subunit [Endozoicomonas lisbonensis]|uniref:RND family efflux transporter MFP subunit n=1 Tax=Endozoicomonas lisbonensis TaxID=3120522 RepID=A0ABV2SG89_9GAMM
MKATSPFRFARAAATATLSISLLTACSQSVEQEASVVRPVRLFEVVNRQAQNLREFPAIVAASEEASLSFRIPGELLEFPVSSAMIVEQGQLLARLDDRDIRNEVAVLQADFDLAEADFRRIQSLREKQVVSQSDFDNANTRLKAARVNLQLAKDRLSDTVLTAPFSGRIAQTLAENYQSVQAQQPIMILQDHKTLDISIQVPESILTQVQEERVDSSYQPVVSFAGNHGTEYRVSYKEHATRVTPGTQSYEVIFSMPAPEAFTVYPGMGATLAIDMTQVMGNGNSASEYIVPMTAVLKDDASGQYQVWVYNTETGTVTPKPVTVGRITQSGITVTSGLEDGEQIVSAGLNRLRAGMEVKPLERERGV